MSNTSKDAFKIVEKELIKFGSYENAKKILSKYMIGSSYDQEMVEKILVILVAEFRREIERLNGNLPEDDAEAALVIERKASSKPRQKKGSSKIVIESAGDIDIDDLEESD
jgi:hypothetical protein